MILFFCLRNIILLTNCSLCQFLPSNTSLVNKTAITGKIMQLIDRISSLSSSSSPAVGLMEWRLLNTSLWNKAMKQVIGWATNSSLLATWM